MWDSVLRGRGDTSVVQQQVPVGQVVQERLLQNLGWGKVCCGMQELWSISCSAWCSRSSACAVGGTGWISDFTNWKLSKIITTRQRCVRAAARGFVTRRKALCGLTGFWEAPGHCWQSFPGEQGAGGPSCVPEGDPPVLMTVSWLDWETAGGNPIPAVPTVRS